MAWAVVLIPANRRCSRVLIESRAQSHHFETGHRGKLPQNPVRIISSPFSARRDESDRPGEFCDNVFTFVSFNGFDHSQDACVAAAMHLLFAQKPETRIATVKGATSDMGSLIGIGGASRLRPHFDSRLSLRPKLAEILVKINPISLLPTLASSVWYSAVR
jgi:hypothetical protein